MKDHIEKSIELKAPVSRVWRALTDHREFGEWFRVKLDGPFEVGSVSTGQMTYPGYEHYKWYAVVVAMDAEHLFSYRWCPGVLPPEVDQSKQVLTLVEFRLTALGGGTRLVVRESGFSKLPAERRDEALRMNDGGWDTQMSNIQTHVDG